MKNRFHLYSALAAACMFALPAAYAQKMSDADYKSGNARISAEYKTAKAACDPMKGNAKDICMEEAKGKEKIAKAELKYGRSGKPGDMAKVAEVTNYSVAHPGATAHMTPELQEITQMNNTAYYFERLNFWQYVKDRKRYNEIWNEVKGAK